MLEKGKDEADAVIEDANGNVKTIVCSAVGTINLRGEVSATLGVAPVWLRPYLIKLPWFAERMRAVKTLTGIALARVNDRLANGSERDDLLAKLQAATDERGEQMGKMELTAEALTQLVSVCVLCARPTAAYMLLILRRLPVATQRATRLAPFSTT